MTKAELVELCKENVHLADAVDAKNVEITELQKKHEEEIETKVNKKLSEKDLEIKKVHEAKDKSAALHTKEIEKFKIEEKNMMAQMNQMEARNGALAKVAVDIFERHSNLLKTLQGTVDNSIELAEFSKIILDSHMPNKK